MKSMEMITRMIELADICAHVAKVENSPPDQEYYEEVSRILNWVLNDGTESVFD